MSLCTKQTTPKYLNRNSPPYPANKCRAYSNKKGNNGLMYQAVPNKNGVNRWVKVSRRSSRRVTKRRSRKRTRSKSRKSKKTKSKKRKSKGRSSKPKKINYRGLWRPAPKPLSKMTRTEIISELRKFRNAWEKLTERGQDLDDAAFPYEPTSWWKGMLKEYYSDSSRKQAEEWLEILGYI